ncbi:MAG TPA: hypothetical protein VFX30_03300 [bacterium]|nr:hypothetical protein [bacterium]
MRKRLEAGLAVYGYRKFATPSGGVSEEELPARWNPTPETTPTEMGKILRISHVVAGGFIEGEEPLPRSLVAPADWGPPNALGFRQMIGGVLNLVRGEKNELAAKGGPNSYDPPAPIRRTLPLSWGLGGHCLGLRPAAFVDAFSADPPSRT